MLEIEKRKGTLILPALNINSILMINSKSWMATHYVNVLIPVPQENNKIKMIIASFF